LASKKKGRALKQFRDFTRESKMTEEDALRLGRKVSQSAAKRYTQKRPHLAHGIQAGNACGIKNV
jgi:hypothetical protein